jgi:hypothetical protein
VSKRVGFFWFFLILFCMWSVYFSIFRIYFSSPIVFFRFLIKCHDYRFDLALVVFAIKGVKWSRKRQTPKMITFYF